MAQGTVRYRLMIGFVVLVCAALGAWLGTLAADRELPVIVYTADAVNPVIESGSELRVQYYVSRRRICSVQIDRFIFDAKTTRFELPDTNISAGQPLGDDNYIVAIKLPPDIEPGPAIYRTTSTYRCNAIQNIFPISAGTRDVRFFVANTK